MTGADAPPTAPAAALAATLEASALAGRSGIVSVGLDVVSVSRLDRLVAAGGSAFLDRGWTQSERADADGDLERLAARWAVKEAVMKCFGLGISDLDPHDIEVASSESGAPSAQLRGTAAEQSRRLGISKVHVSASHEGGWAAAIAVAAAETRQQDPESRAHRQEGP